MNIPTRYGYLSVQTVTDDSRTFSRKIFQCYVSIIFSRRDTVHIWFNVSNIQKSFGAYELDIFTAADRTTPIFIGKIDYRGLASKTVRLEDAESFCVNEAPLADETIEQYVHVLHPLIFRYLIFTEAFDRHGQTGRTDYQHEDIDEDLLMWIQEHSGVNVRSFVQEFVQPQEWNTD